MARIDFKHQKQFKIRNAKLTKIRSILWPMKRGQKGRKNKKDINTIRPRSNIILDNRKRIQSTPSALQKTRRTRKRSMIDNQTKGWGTSLNDTTLVPNQSIRSSATKTVIIDLHARNSNHEPMKIKHDGIPKTTDTKKITTSSDNIIMLP